MPDFSEKHRDRGTEQPLPEGQSRQGREIKSDAQVRFADQEGGIEPAERQLQADQELREDRPVPKGLHCVDAGTQQHTG